MGAVQRDIKQKRCCYERLNFGLRHLKEFDHQDETKKRQKQQKWKNGAENKTPVFFNFMGYTR
jgi:hypothetical protein